MYHQLYKSGGRTNVWIGRGVLVPFSSGLNACEVADLWKVYNPDQGHALNNIFIFHHSKLDVFNLLWRKINKLKCCNFSLKNAKSQSCKCWHYVWHTSYVRLQTASWLAAGEGAHACKSGVCNCSAANTELNSKIKIGHDDALALCSGQTEKNTTIGAHFSIAKCVCVCARALLRMCVCMYVRIVCVRKYVCMYECVCVCVCVYACIHVNGV
jgi:hypothetical protein